jgi:hopanoid biosynthesis associated protein HpnK
MDKQIIINADDFGLCEEVNNAVAQAHTEGVLTSATIMANMPAAAEAVKTAKKLPGLGVGVHLNLSEGPPLSKDSSVECLLNRDGEFALSTFKLSVLSVAGHKIRNAIRTELAAQIQWVLDKGLTPTHLDSHYHIHTLPPIFPIVCELARRFEIPAVRYTFEPKDLCRMPWPLPGERGRQSARTARIMARINRLQDSRFLKTDALLGIAHKGKLDASFFKAVTLYSSAQTAEVMTHPGLADTAGPEETKLQHQQRLELEALCSERTRDHFNDAAIKLIHYGNL